MPQVLEELRRDIEKACGSGIFDPDKSKEPNRPSFFVLIILEKDGIEPRSVLKHWGDVAHGEFLHLLSPTWDLTLMGLQAL